MRTNIVLNEQLVEQAFQYTALKTKRELVDLALREFVAVRKRPQVQALKGKIKFSPDYDYKTLRGRGHVSH
jgi:Arc/MetJ family transcription regulator